VVALVAGSIAAWRGYNRRAEARRAELAASQPAPVDEWAWTHRFEHPEFGQRFRAMAGRLERAGVSDGKRLPFDTYRAQSLRAGSAERRAAFASEAVEGEPWVRRFVNGTEAERVDMSFQPIRLPFFVTDTRRPEGSDWLFVSGLVVDGVAAEFEIEASSAAVPRGASCVNVLAFLKRRMPDDVVRVQLDTFEIADAPEAACADMMTDPLDLYAALTGSDEQRHALAGRRYLVSGLLQGGRTDDGACGGHVLAVADDPKKPIVCVMRCSHSITPKRHHAQLGCTVPADLNGARLVDCVEVRSW
jgi:hypothetical protein